ncbi:putative polyketide synthase [Xylaria flabelliformis]|nr:putative polyketide synthase [Xylaria flabelliformis]
MEETQTPIAVIGLSCRLPGSCNSVEEFWKLLIEGSIAGTDPPPSRFNIKGHYDGSLRPWTMKSPGGMFIDCDLRNVDAGFFGLSQVDAVSMDPQQRQLLEVVYEGLENAGLSLESIKSRSFGCFVGSYASDYSDIQTRDPEDRTPSFTVGNGRAMLSNRISHFLDIKGPSMTVDTACSGSLISLDLACRYLDTGDADGAIVAGCNLYMSPEHNMDQHAMSSAASPTGRCWTFDARADGYIKAEAINALILKRLNDAVRDGDPIRAVIRGTSTNSDGWTPGIASPSAAAQEIAIQRAYQRAGISELGNTTYLECHGTGTSAGDPIECDAASRVFAPSRSDQNPLRIGSVKSNIGHSEPAAGISGMIKTILAVERGVIPGNPTYGTPNPKINFHKLRLLPSSETVFWPQEEGLTRRASVNSFGYGGSNAHAIVEHPSILLPTYSSPHVSSYSKQKGTIFTEEINSHTKCVYVFSANDEHSIRRYIKAMIRHVSNPGVHIDPADLAYTLGQKRTRHFHRAYVISNTSSFREADVVVGKSQSAPRIGYVFTGQGSQWPMMGRDLIEQFPVAKETIRNLDQTLQSLSDPPSWSLMTELLEPRSAEHIRQPEFSQPLVTALQLAILSVLKHWGLKPSAVIGHSSGEITSAVAAGLITPENAIKLAYLRGKSAVDDLENNQHDTKKNGELSETQTVPAKNPETDFGMLAVGLGRSEIQAHLKSLPNLSIACENSPKSTTISGNTRDLMILKEAVVSEGDFARLLQVNLAYHSDFMASIASVYRDLLQKHCSNLNSDNIPCAHNVSSTTRVKFFSTVTGKLMTGTCDIDYWVENMISPVLFSQGVTALLQSETVDYIIEIGPSGALAGPINQVKQDLGQTALLIDYSPTLKRAQDACRSLYDLAGRMFVLGTNIDMLKVNGIDGTSKPRLITDLPNYQWNHSIKFWHESLASKDWRFRQFPVHDLLGTKVLGTSWLLPSWKRILRLKDVPWITDHTVGTDVIFPASGYIAMAIEAIFQMASSSANVPELNIVNPREASYRLRDVRFLRALVIDKNEEHHIYTSLFPVSSHVTSWFEFKIFSLRDDIWTENCNGLIRIDPELPKDGVVLKSLGGFTSATLWYRAMQCVGFNFGPSFRNLAAIESTMGQRTSRAKITYPPEYVDFRKSNYAIHPAVFDAFFQAGIPSLYLGDRTLIKEALVPHVIDNIRIRPTNRVQGSLIANSESVFTTGRRDKAMNYYSNVQIFNEESGNFVTEVQGLHYTVFPISGDSKEKNGIMIGASVLPFLSEETVAVSDALRLPQYAAVIVSLLKHKIGNPSVLELDMTTDTDHPHDISKDHVNTCPLTYRRYIFVTNCARQLSSAQKRLQNLSGIEFHMYDAEGQPDEPLRSEIVFDLVILRLATLEEGNLVKSLSRSRASLAHGGFLLVLWTDPASSHTDSDHRKTLDTAFASAGLDGIWKSEESLGLSNANCSIYLLSVQDVNESSSSTSFTIVNLTGGMCKERRAFIDNLRQLGWAGELLNLPDVSSHDKHSPLLLLDDPQQPILSTVTSEQWHDLRRLVCSGFKILWVTVGSQLHVTSPSHALIHGYTRTLRGEDTTLVLKTLDVSALAEFNAAKATISVMGRFSTEDQNMADAEHEFCERDGVIHVNRILPDDKLARVWGNSNDGAGFQRVWFRRHPRTIRMGCERIGALESLCFHEVDEQDSVLGDAEVVVDIRAAGLNYKDIATSLGVVPENEFLLGFEAAGIISQCGSRVTAYHVGDRVLVYSRGSFANRTRTAMENLALLPDTVTFEQAATMPIVFFTGVYSLIELARIQKGQSVLIHSATGGIGLACIQLCKYLGAEVYATVSNDKKRRFLEEIGIPAPHIFSSRTLDFAAKIPDLTKGKGVNCVINSLTGELLEESWRLLSDHGTFIDLGKKDIIAKKSISMEPFNRNCTYRGVDISRPSIVEDLPLVSRVLGKIRDLMMMGLIKPLHPVTTFSFTQIPDAMRYMRSREHIGKIVISDEADVQVSMSPLPIRLAFDPCAAYLIVGGLKGLCGSLAMYMAQHGARNLIVMCRSGVDDGRSQDVLRQLHALGSTVRVFEGDVSNPEDVLTLFRTQRPPVKGVVQGAMILRDKTLESMSVEEYYEAVRCKLQGTWNIHNAAEQTEPLSFFTMLSSISGVVGTAGQANYAAGNAFQDAFAGYRHSLGLPAHTIDLGIVEGVGYMSEHQSVADRVQNRSKLSGIEEHELHEIFKFSILQQVANEGRGLNELSSTQMVTGLPYPLSSASPILADMRFQNLSAANSHSQPLDEKGPNDSLGIFQAMLAASASAAQLLPQILMVINQQVVRILGLATDVEESKPLNSYGLDSLAAVDLRNWLNTQLGTKITTVDILNAINLKELSRKVVDQVLNKEEIVKG